MLVDPGELGSASALNRTLQTVPAEPAAPETRQFFPPIEDKEDQ
jgi:hypothetical protein